MTLAGKTYTTHQIARICDVYPTTVIGWIKRDKLKAFSTPGGHRRVLQADLLSFLKDFNIPVPEHLAFPARRILLVEDDKAVGQMLRKALRSRFKGAQIDWIQDGIGALIALGSRPPDLLILDVVMPVVDGARVLASLRADPNTRRVKVIAITGKRLPAEKLAFMRRQSDAFFRKPFDVMKFVAKSAALLATTRPAR